MLVWTRNTNWTLIKLYACGFKKLKNLFFPLMLFPLILVKFVLIIWWISGCPPRAVPLSRSSTRIVQNLRSWHFLISSWRHLEQLLDTSWQFLINREAPIFFLKISKIFVTIWHILSLLDDILVVLFASHWLLDGVSVASWCILSRLDNSGGEKVVTNQEEVCKNHQEDPRICQEVAKKQSRNRQKFTANCYVILRIISVIESFLACGWTIAYHVIKWWTSYPRKPWIVDFGSRFFTGCDDVIRE